MLEVFQLHVVLPSGRTSEPLYFQNSSKVVELKIAAQQSLRQGFLQLVVDGNRLDLAASLQDAGLHNGDTVTAIVQAVKLAATQSAFAFGILEVIGLSHGASGHVEVA